MGIVCFSPNDMNHIFNEILTILQMDTLLFLSAPNEMSQSGDHIFFFCAICATAADAFNQILSRSIILQRYTF